MTTHSFGDLALRASAATSRRATVLALSGAGMATLTGAPVVRGKNTIRRRAKKQGKKKCQRQVGQCQTFWEEFCEQAGEAFCSESVLEASLGCCEVLGECQTSGFLECIRAARSS